MEQRTAHSSLEDAVNELVKLEGDEGAILTGWVLTTTMKHPRMGSGDGYVTITSEGLPYHSQVGLLQAALDERRNSILITTLKAEGNHGER
jgi:hypothetical protein